LEAVRMKMSRLAGLFFLSLFLAACWLSTLPGAEDPWDENKIVVSDSGTSLDDGGSQQEDDGGMSIVIFPGGSGFSKILNLQLIVMHGQGNSRVKESKMQSSSVVGVKEPEVVQPRGELSKNGK
jgi:hypothetical protein